MNLLWRRSYPLSVLWSSLYILLMSTTGALGQMSDEQFRALQERAIREKWSFTVKRNEATKRSLSELCGLVEPLGWQKTARFVPMRPLARVALPASFDWRGPQTNGLPPIRDQGRCGGCWAFATIGALECNIRIQDNVTADLAEQWLISCNRSGWSCDSGWVAFDYLLELADLRTRLAATARPMTASSLMRPRTFPATVPIRTTTGFKTGLISTEIMEFRVWAR